MTAVQAAYECKRLPCGMSWQQENFPNGILLMCFADDPGAFVNVRCRACSFGKRMAVLDFIKAVTAAGTGHANMSHKALSSTIRRPCSVCKEHVWAVAAMPAPAATLGPSR